MNPRAAHLGAEEVDLRTVRFTADLLAYVPAKLARRSRILPIRSLPDKLQVATADLSDLEAIDSLHNVVQRFNAIWNYVLRSLGNLMISLADCTERKKSREG